MAKNNTVTQVVDNGFQEFPKMLYHKGDAANYKLVESAEEEETLGDDWIDAPVDPLAAPVVVTAAPAKPKK